MTAKNHSATDDATDETETDADTPTDTHYSPRPCPGCGEPMRFSECLNCRDRANLADPVLASDHPCPECGGRILTYTHHLGGLYPKCEHGHIITDGLGGDPA